MSRNAILNIFPPLIYQYQEIKQYIQKIMFCDIDNTSIYYEIYGQGRPIITFHGFMLDHNVMKWCLEPIFDNIEGYKRIYFDLPGMGKTKTADCIKNSDDILILVQKFIDEIIPSQNFFLVGESYGGYLARGIMSKKKEMIDGAVFLCPVIFPEQEKRNLPGKLVLEEAPSLISGLSDKEAASFQETAVIESLEIWTRYKKEIYEPNLAGNQSFLLALYERGYPFNFDVDKKIGIFEKPTLFLLGRQDWIVGYQDALRLLENYPRASFAILDKAGHNLQIEQKDLFEELIKEWLTRL